jgi:4-hydroxybenzoate polyprenyltransferase
LLSFIKKYYLDNYIHLSICTAALTGFSYYALSISILWQYVYFVGVGTFLIYNYHQVFKFSMAEWKAWVVSKSVLLPSLLIASSMYLIYEQISKIYVPLSLALMGCLLYFVPLLNKRTKTFRELTWIKIFIIGYVFSLITMVIPAMSAAYSWVEILLLGITRMLFISVLSLAFDIGDMLTDEDTNTTTLPNKIGVKNAKWIGALIIFMASVVEIYLANAFVIEFPALMIMMITYFLSWIVLLKSSNSRSKYFYLFVADGLIGLPFVLSFI